MFAQEFLLVFLALGMLILLHNCTEDHELPIIVWWTPRLFPHWEENSTRIVCKTGQCLAKNSFSESSRLYPSNTSIAFIFYGTDLEVDDLPLPRLRHHRWALLHEESPINNYIFSHDAMIGLFNYTATFRRESDYPLTTLFLPSVDYLTRRQPVSLIIKNHLRHHPGPNSPLAPVLYVQSHCDVASDRDGYVAELGRYIAIDSYGKCLNNKTLPDEMADPEHFQSEAFLDFIAQYKFHLAFENALCQDYITEKLFRALHVGSVPVYRGSPTVRDFVPGRRSVILAEDYESPKDLAEYLIGVDRDDAEYQLHLEFKRPDGFDNDFLRSHVNEREWGVNEEEKIDFIRGFECFVCDRLRQDTTASKVADASHMGCPQPEIAFEALDENTADGRKRDVLEWMDIYKYTRTLAEALRKMIEDGESDSSRIHVIASNIKDEL